MKRSSLSIMRRRAASILSILVIALAMAIMTAKTGLAQLETSGLPVPRFVSLKASEANLRAGPGTRYPVEWVYRRPGLPLEVTAEYYNWRRVRDQDGTEGWMHGSMLSGTRTLIVSQPLSVLRDRPNRDGRPVARLEAGVIVIFGECVDGNAWCTVQIGEIVGWINSTDAWGL